MSNDTTRTESEQAERVFRVGQQASFSKTITGADVVNYAGISGDFNPVHVDAQYAETTRFKRRVAHGMLTASLISTVLGTRLPGPGAIYLEQHLKFLAPVFIGDTIRAVAEIVEVREDKPIIRLRTECYNQNGERVLDGQAVVFVTRVS